MIDFKEYINWEKNENDNSLYMIAIGFDPEMKDYLIKNDGFDWNYEIKFKYRKDIINLIEQVIFNFVGDNFLVRLKDNKFSWLPDWLLEKYNDTNDIKEYLNNIFWKKKYKGEFEINDIKTFLKIFIDYPFKYKYQDILLLSKNNDYIIIISYHGTINVITKKLNELKIIAKFIEDNNGIVFPRNYLEQ